MRCQVQLVIIKQLEHSKGQIKSYVPKYEPKSNIVQANHFQNVLFYHPFIYNFPDLFWQQYYHVELLFKFFDKSVNKIDLLICNLQWKFKSLAGKFSWGGKAKRFAFKSLLTTTRNVLPLFLIKLSRSYLNFHWRWRRWDGIQATF